VPRRSVATVDYADMRGLEASADGGWGGFVGATVSMRHRGGVHGEHVERSRLELRAHAAHKC
jgi:hypothetical protein